MPLSDINISKENNDCLTILKSKGYFDDDKTAAQFATSYALSKLNLLEFAPLDKYKGNFTNNKWHINDFDGNNVFRDLIKIYYPDSSDLDYALRSVISLGLDSIYAFISKKNNWTISDLI